MDPEYRDASLHKWFNIKFVLEALIDHLTGEVTPIAEGMRNHVMQQSRCMRAPSVPFILCDDSLLV